jgi:hypothetical protein
MRFKTQPGHLGRAKTIDNINMRDHKSERRYFATIEDQNRQRIEMACEQQRWRTEVPIPYPYEFKMGGVKCSVAQNRSSLARAVNRQLDTY